MHIVSSIFKNFTQKRPLYQSEDNDPAASWDLMSQIHAYCGILRPYVPNPCLLRHLETSYLKFTSYPCLLWHLETSCPESMPTTASWDLMSRIHAYCGILRPQVSNPSFAYANCGILRPQILNPSVAHAYFGLLKTYTLCNLKSSFQPKTCNPVLKILKWII